MSFTKHINLKSGFLALAMTAAGGLMATGASAAMDGYGYENHGDYMKDMGERMSRADKDFNEKNDAEVDSDLKETWTAAQTEWEELENATEENWDAAQAEMDAAWDDFQKEWDENFSNKEQK